MPVKRFDRSSLESSEFTAQGFLRAPAYLTRAGIFLYRRPDGSVRREYRPPEEVFKADSLATLQAIPVTNEHPEEMLTPENSKQYIVGYTSERVDREDDKVKSTITITDAETIKQAQAGKQEISCGYFADLEETPGKLESGEEYDSIQRNIRYNHVAVVDRGRAGREIRMRLDSEDAVLVGPEMTQIGGNIPMKKIVLGGREYEVSEELHAAILAALEEAKAAAAAEKEKEIQALTGKVDSLTEELKKKTEADPARFIEAVRARRQIEKIAERVLPESERVKLDTLDDRALKIAIIQARSPGVNLDGKSDAYLDARFDTIAETLSHSDARAQEIAAHEARERGDAFDLSKAREKMRQDNRDAWKQPLSAMKAN